MSGYLANIMNKGQRTTDKGQQTTDNGKRTTDNGIATFLLILRYK